MKIVLQRVLEARVDIDGETKGKINKGYLLFLGISNEDNKGIADKMIEKVAKLRIFEDGNGKTNLSIDQVQGEVLVVSQFTLYADCKKGNRPSFVNAGNPLMAEELYEYVLKRCEELFKKTQCGVFGADMKISLVNDGPFTLVLDSKELFNHTDRLVYQEAEETVVKVMRYIEENYKNGSLNELSDILHYDISVLSREIKSKTGKKYTELVQEKRLSQSCFLLRNTDMTIKEIAEKTGYENTSFFYRLFKESYGISPKKFRQNTKQ